MDLLHGALCGYFLKLIDGIEQTKVDADGVVVNFTAYPSSGELAVMAKFLKDNAITGSVGGDGDQEKLEAALAQRHQRRGKLPTLNDAKQALREMGSDLLQ
jgi:hypothetical protein